MVQYQFEPPNEKQILFFKADSRYVAYGGARGGGKSWAVRRKAALVSINYDHCKVLIVRRTYKELEGNYVIPMKLELNGVADYRDSDKTFTFSNGSIIFLRYCDSEDDTRNFQGHEYDFIFIDEATQLTEFQYDCIRVCSRGTNEIPKRIYLTCNPGGVGHEWVKRLFITKQYKGEEHAEDYTFIPAKVTDNTALMKSDKEYYNTLASLPDGLRQQWLDGDWDYSAGMYFNEFNRDMHVMEPFVIPSDWRRYVTIDYGLDMLAALWIAVDSSNKAYVYKELYENNLIISEAARRIKEVNNGEQIYEWLAPPDLFSRSADSGRSQIELFGEYGIDFVKTSNKRVAGWLAVKEFLNPVLTPDGSMKPSLRFFRNCQNITRTLPLLQHDERDPNDCATDPHELTHAPDALRGFCIYRTQQGVRPIGKQMVYEFKAFTNASQTSGSSTGYGEKVQVI